MTRQKALLFLCMLVIGVVGTAFDYNDETKKIKYDYAVMIGATKIGVGDPVSDQQLSKLLGKPVSEKTRIVKDDNYAAGVTYKTNGYDGLTIDLCKGSDDNYLITDITVTSPNFPTSLGIKVGDTLDRLKEIYPVEQAEPSKDLYVYAEGEVGGYAMEFEVSGDKIVKFSFSETWD